MHPSISFGSALAVFLVAPPWLAWNPNHLLLIAQAQQWEAKVAGRTGCAMPSDSGRIEVRRCLLAFRILAAVVAVLFTLYAFLVIRSQLTSGLDLIGGGMGAVAAATAALAWWFAVRGQNAESRQHMRLALISGVVVGAIGFAIGFFGPLLWSPSANQGPLLGIFITGPFGFVLGVIGGWIYGRLGVKRG